MHQINDITLELNTDLDSNMSSQIEEIEHLQQMSKTFFIFIK
jgi:hypothetical protein